MKQELKKQTPPRRANRFLRWFCAPHLLEELEGDLEEEFQYQVSKYGIRRARLDYVRNVLGFIRPFVIKRKKSSTQSTFTMNIFKHYVIIAFRNLVRQKAFSFINVIGLALGMTCCLFIFLWIQDERGVDNFHENGDDLYMVYETYSSNDNKTTGYSTYAKYSDKDKRLTVPITDIKQVVPEVERLSFYATGYELPWGYPETFQVGDMKHKLEGSRASADFFSMFSYEIIAGDKKDALGDISSIAISRKMAEMFFENPDDAIGKSIRHENKNEFVVKAVFENLPSSSSLKFDFVINWETQLAKLEFATGGFGTFLQLSKGADPELVQTKINRFIQSQVDKNSPLQVECGLQRFGDIYLNSNFVNGKPDGGRILYVKIFSGVAVFILLIACINFMNLATARSVKRAKEIGVRKVVGSSRGSLIGQFLGESMVLAFFALLLSLLLAHLFLPAFNTFTEKQIGSPLTERSSFAILFALMLATGLIAGSYPAFFLSSLKPVKILRGTLKFSGNTIWFRKSLSVFQFAISILLLIVTIVISQQTAYVQNVNLGYNKENLIYMRIEGDLMNPNDVAKNYRTYTLFKEEAMKMPGIAMVDRATEAPHAMGFVVDDRGNDDGAIQWEGRQKGQHSAFKPMSVGFDFLEIMDLKIAEGRGFSSEYATDSADAFLVNEEAVKQMGMKDPIGKWISAWQKKGHIIGVLKDYHTASLREVMKPLVLDVKEYEYFGLILVRTLPGKTKEALASLESVYGKVNPNYPFAYQFVDEEYGKLYRNEEVITKLSNIFAIIAIVISCLGLLGLVMLSAEQRTKEFGIRKVLGATVSNIISLLSQDFLKLVMIAFCIGAPMAGYFMHEWLQNFAFRIELSWWIFLIAGLAAIFLTLATISVQAFHSAMNNPVKALRSE